MIRTLRTLTGLLLVLPLLAACQKSSPHGELVLPANPLELYQLGTRALDRSEPGRAVELLQKAVERAPDFQEAQYALGRAGYVSGNFGVAVRAFADALLLGPRLPVPRYSSGDIHYNLAVVYLQTGQRPAALEHLRTAVHDDPDFAEAWLLMARMQLEGEDRDGAIESLRGALEADPGMAAAHRLRARLAQSSGDLSTAEAELELCVLYAPESAEAYLELARVRLQAGKFAAALSPAEEYGRRASQDPAGWTLRADILEGLGLPKTAAEARGKGN